MKQQNTQIKKARSREISKLFQSYQPYKDMVRTPSRTRCVWPQHLGRPETLARDAPEASVLRQSREGVVLARTQTRALPG